MTGHCPYGEGRVLVTNQGSASLTWVDARMLETRIVLNTAARPNGVVDESRTGLFFSHSPIFSAQQIAREAP